MAGNPAPAVQPAASPGSARWFAALYAAPAQRALLETLSGIESEIYAVLRPGLEHSVAHVRMQWWQEECGRVAAGAGAHPLSRALLAALPGGAAPDNTGAGTEVPPATTASSGADLSGLLDTATWDLAGATFGSRRELAGYCERWATAFPALVARGSAPAGLPPDSAANLGRGLGAAMRELELLLDLRADALAGRLRLPLDELAAAGVAPEALTAADWPPALTDLLRARHRELRGRLQGLLDGLTPTQRHAFRGLGVWARLVARHSRLAEAALPRAWRPTRLSGLGDAWQAWRYARQG